jgi:hypothetical protein
MADKRLGKDAGCGMKDETWLNVDGTDQSGSTRLQDEKITR